VTVYNLRMLAPALLLTVQVIVSQVPAEASASPASAAQGQVLPGAEIPGSGPATPEPAPPAHPSLLPDSSYPKRPSRAWVLVRVPVAFGVGAATGVAAWVASYALISIGTIPAGCFGFWSLPKPGWCYNVANLGAFTLAGGISGAVVAGMGSILKGESDPRFALATGLLGGTVFGIAYAAGSHPKKPARMPTFQGDDGRLYRLAVVAVPALAVVSAELGGLLAPRRPALVIPTVVPTAGGGVLLVSGRI
jgi:hypothetical protein